MNYLITQNTLESINDIQQNIIALQNELNEKLAALETKQFISQQEIRSASEVGKILNQQRKALEIDLATLSLQTEISPSTLQRLFKDPSNVKFDTVLQVIAALGGSLWLAK